jgi:phosphoribosylglycinamide formyltransferase-1
MAIEKHVAAGDINGDIAVVISDMGDADGLTYARQRGIEVKVFPWQPPRRAYFTEIMEFLEVMNIDLIVLAGFMRVLSGNIIDRYEHRIVNIHPALLPSFPGEQAQKQAFEYGVKYSGCTVHFVDEGVDTGPIIMQHVVPVLEDDDVEALSQRILEEEHKLFPEVIKLFCDNRLTVLGRRVHIHT